MRVRLRSPVGTAKNVSCWVAKARVKSEPLLLSDPRRPLKRLARMTISPSPEFFRRLAAAAAAETLPRFRDGGRVMNKRASGFDPVTEADRATEQAIRDLIAREFPDHGIVGEEYGNSSTDSRFQWAIDPIDGTRSFISGIPLWGTLVGLLVDGTAVAGMMAQPFTRELFYADGNGARYEGPDGNRPLSVRKVTDLSEATLCTTSPFLFDEERLPRYQRVEQAVRLARYGTDCYAYCMLASGNIDLVIESGLNAYDIVALIPIVRQAGGIITTWSGDRPEKGGDIIAAVTPELHAQALELLNR
jgi:histidinol-phosphate phosphatase HisN, inositol monophosphatase family